MKKKNRKENRANITCHTIFVGVDPGSVNAGICQLNEFFVECYTVPTISTTDKKKTKTVIDLEALSLLLQEVIQANSVVLIEDVHSMPRQGVVSAFSFGRGLGTLEGMFSLLTDGCPHYITPMKWKKSYPELITPEMRILKDCGKISKTKKEKAKFTYAYKKLAKEQSIWLANKMFKKAYPDIGIDGTFFTKGDEDIAEAFLIATYAKNHY